MFLVKVAAVLFIMYAFREELAGLIFGLLMMLGNNGQG